MWLSRMSRFHDELIQRKGPADQNRQGKARSPPRPARLLPGAGNGPGIPPDNAGIQPSDVDSELQGIGADHSQHLSVPEPLFNLPANLWEISPTVPPDEIPIPFFPFDSILKVFGQYLHVKPAGGEYDGLNSPLYERVRQASGRTEVAPPNAKLLVDYRWVVKEEELLRRGCSVLVDQFNRALKQLLRQLPGVGNGGGTADELRPRPIEIADALYPSEHVGHVGAKDPTVGVKLVDDDVPQVLKELDPLGMVRKDARMEHIRIGDYDVPLSPNRLSSILGGIPVIGEGSDGLSYGIDPLWGRGR